MESVQCLGRLVQCIDSNKNKAVGKMPECVTVRESVVVLTNELILKGVFSQSSLEVSVPVVQFGTSVVQQGLGVVQFGLPVVQLGYTCKESLSLLGTLYT